MKNFILATATLCVGANLLGQTVPKGISYQAVAINTEAQSVAGINPENTYWSNKDIQVRFTIYDQYPGGSAQMVETHQTKTDKFGVFNVIIGQGQNESGDLFDVDWDKGQAHLKVEIDFNNNGLYKLVGIERFWSVPYALNSAGSTSGGGSGPDLSKKLDSLADALNKQIADFRNQINGDIANLNQGDTSSDNELQELELNGNDLGLSKSNKTVDISTILKDNDVNNELQSIRLSNDSLILSINNSGVKLPMDQVYDGDSSSTNELQQLFYRNDTLGISQVKGGIMLPRSLDNDITNELQTLSLVNDSLKLTKGGGISLTQIAKASNRELFVFPRTTTNTNKSNITYTGGNPVNWIGRDTLTLVRLKKGQKLTMKSNFNRQYEDGYVLLDSLNLSILKGLKQTLTKNSYGDYYIRYNTGDLSGSNRDDFIYVADKDITVLLAITTRFWVSSNPPGVIPTKQIRELFIEVE